MAGEVGAVGKGFLTETGEVKSKSQLAKEEAVQKNSSANESEASSDDTPETQISTAIGSVRSRFSEKANSIVSVINQDEENLQKAGKAVKKQLEAAKELKAALKEGDEQKVEVARKKLDEATEKRNELSTKIKKDNAEVVTERAKNLSLGNEQKGLIRTKEVKLEKTDEDIKLKRPADVNKLIGELQDDRKNIAAQRRELRETKKEVKEVIQKTDIQLSKIEERSIRSIQDAEETASKVASRITANGAQALSASKIKEDVARQLLQ